MQGPLLGQDVDEATFAEVVGERAVSIRRDEWVEVGCDGQCHAVLARRRPSGGRGDPPSLSGTGNGEASLPAGVEESRVVKQCRDAERFAIEWVWVAAQFVANGREVVRAEAV